MTTPRLLQFLSEFDTLVESEPQRALEHVRAAPQELAELPEVRLAKAEALWAVRGPAAARQELDALLADVPDYADAHHALGQLCDVTQDRHTMIQHFLRVRELDAAADLASGFDPGQAEEDVAMAAEQVLLSLPEPFKTLLQHAPILVEDRPGLDLVEAGVDPRSLGLFEGPTSEEQTLGEPSATPTRILLFTANLLQICDSQAMLREEIEITVLHEIGHFFGLDEQDLERLGLD